MSLRAAAGGEERPDGRVVSEETLRLRVATRALREHLDTLPIDYDLDAPPERVLAGFAFMFARQRYDCTDSMIGSGFGGTVIGSMARSLLVDGLQWTWVANEPQRLRSLLGDLLAERNRLYTLLERSDASCPILTRWLMPLPAIADLTGESLTWLDAPQMPSEEHLVQDFIAFSDEPAVSTDPTNKPGRALLTRARSLMAMPGLRGISMVLAHAGHGNYLGLQSTLTHDSAPGYDLRADHEALFMQAAAFGVTATLLGSAVAVPELWPADVPREPFTEEAVELAAAVSAAALPVHGLTTTTKPSPKTPTEAGRAKTALHPAAVLAADSLLPDRNSVAAVAEATEAYYESTRTILPNIWKSEESPTLHNTLALAGGHSNLQAVIATYDQPGSEMIAVFAARMLLEESARLVWRFSIEPGEFELRAKQYFDEFRARQKKTIATMVGAGIPRDIAARIFQAPPNVVFKAPPDQPGKGRKPIPSIGAMLRAMGAPYPEPGWLEVAYSLLSQITHSTPLGHLHTIRFHDGVWHGNELSPEMLGLALDVACLGSAHLIGLATVIATDLSSEAQEFREVLLRNAYTVHTHARLVHGLD